jgi:Asp-tRNA(Asn)/Glu-tRNA(Gln) amidotransferase A subunit family amidase
VRRLIADDFARAYERADVLVAPTSPTVAFPIGERCLDHVLGVLAEGVRLAARDEHPHVPPVDVVGGGAVVVIVVVALGWH